jgi:hypothetical protein
MTRYLMYFIAIVVALVLLMGIALVTLWAFDGPSVSLRSCSEAASAADGRWARSQCGQPSHRDAMAKGILLKMPAPVSLPAPPGGRP